VFRKTTQVTRLVWLVLLVLLPVVFGQLLASSQAAEPMVVRLAAVFGCPTGVDVGPDGAVYFADRCNSVVQKVLPNGTVELVAGNFSPGFSGDGGPAVNAQLDDVRDVQVLADGRVIIGDYSNNRVRIVGTDGNISTLAQLPSNVWSVAVDETTGDIYAQLDNAKIYKVNSGGTVTHFAGTGDPSISPNGTLATQAGLGCVRDTEFAGGILYLVTDPCASGGGRVMAITGGQVQSLSTPVSERFIGLEVLGNEFLIAAENSSSGLGLIYSLVGGGSPQVVVGGGTCVSFDTGCALLEAQIGPGDVAVDEAGTLFFTDDTNNSVFKVEGFRSFTIPPTPTPTPTPIPTPGPSDARKIVIFVQGYASCLTDGSEYGESCGSDAGDEEPFGKIKQELREVGFAEGDFLEFSYKDVKVKKRTGEWVPANYGCQDVTAHKYDRPAKQLLKAVRQLKEAKPNYQIYLVGHSFGGLVAFQAMAQAINERGLEDRSALPMAGVITIDSPLNGVNGDWVANLATNLGDLPLPCLLRFATSKATKSVLELYTGPVKKRLQDQVEESRALLFNQIFEDIAIESGTLVWNIGNSGDCLWSPSLCSPYNFFDTPTSWGRSDYADTQFVKPETRIEVNFLPNCGDQRSVETCGYSDVAETHSFVLLGPSDQASVGKIVAEQVRLRIAQDLVGSQTNYAP